MKRKIKIAKIPIIIIIFLVFFIITKSVHAEEVDSIMKKQEDAVGITDFIQESERYTREIFSASDIKEMFHDAGTGKIDNKKIIKCFLRVFGKEVQNTITIFGSILLIIIINSILNCITEGLENKNISQFAFYVQYILIVTIILTNFSDIIESVKESVNNMTDFMNMLIPMMITLIVSSGSVTTASMIQPIIVFMIALIGNFVNNFAIPLIMVSTALGIISKISDKVQIGKLAKRLKSSTIWMVAMILTIFVTVISINRKHNWTS